MMEQTIDIRDQACLSGSEVQKLNFIKDSGRYVFRKYYRSGLRSHIFELLLTEDILKETEGEVIDGIRMFPRAEPKKMFRILRNRFDSKEAVFYEIEKYNMLLASMGPSFIAQSDEFMVDYTGTGTSQIVLCGLQEYVKGEILDPWRLFGENYLKNLFNNIKDSDLQPQIFVQKARKNIAGFVKKVQKMIMDTGYIPDLAGIGNLVLTPHGGLKLVDINNIVKVRFDDTISIDDKGYPACDVSVDVLSILEKKILNKNIHMDDPLVDPVDDLMVDSLYRHFLSRERKNRVKALEKEFYKKL